MRHIGLTETSVSPDHKYRLLLRTLHQLFDHRSGTLPTDFENQVHNAYVRGEITGEQYDYLEGHIPHYF